MSPPSPSPRTQRVMRVVMSALGIALALAALAGYGEMIEIAREWVRSREWLQGDAP